MKMKQRFKKKIIEKGACIISHDILKTKMIFTI